MAFLGGFFSGGGGWSKGTKRDFRQYKKEIYGQRDNIASLLRESLATQLGNIDSMGANAVANAQIGANARGFGLAPGSANSAGAQVYQQMLPQLLEAENMAIQGNTGMQVASIQDFLNNLGMFNQLKRKKKSAGLGFKTLSGLASGFGSALGMKAGMGVGFGGSGGSGGSGYTPSQYNNHG